MLCPLHQDQRLASGVVLLNYRGRSGRNRNGIDDMRETVEKGRLERCIGSRPVASGWSDKRFEDINAEVIVTVPRSSGLSADQLSE